MWKHFVRRGGEETSGGAYWCLTSGHFVRVAKTGGALPGTPDDIYLRVFVPLMLVLTPILGMFFVVFLPVVLVVALFQTLVVQGWRVLTRRTPTGVERL
jgi:hypothetical protein